MATPITNEKPLPFFDPRSINGCRLWLDAADTSTFALSAGTSNILAWYDKSGRRISLSNATGTATLSNFNSIPSVYFNGSTRMTTGSNFTQLQGVTYVAWFVVASVTNTNLSFGQLAGTIYNSGGNTQNALYVNSNTINHYFRISPPTGTVNQISTPLTLSNAIIAHGFTNLANGTRGAFYNGTGSNATGGLTGTQDTNTVFFHMGQSSFPGESFITGTISETLLFVNELSTSQRQQIEGYLAWKWGLQTNLPTTHPFRLGPPTPFTQLTLPLAIQSEIWLPTQISGLQLWLDAADVSTLTLSGSNVTQWNDKSGNARNVSQSSSSLQPTYSSNTLLFDGSDDVLTGVAISNIITASTYTLFLTATVFSALADIAYQNSALVGDTEGYASVVVSQTQVGLYNWRGGAQYSVVSQSLSNTFLFTGRHASDTLFASLNGSNATTSSSGNTDVISGSLLIGRQWNRAASTNFRIGELLIYNTNLDTTQRQQIEGYLAWKWGLVANLPSTHPYKLFPPSR